MIIYSYQKEIRKICYIYSIFIKLRLAPWHFCLHSWPVSNMSLQPQRNSCSLSFQPARLTPFKLVDLTITQITLCQQNVHTVLFSGTNSNNGNHLTWEAMEWESWRCQKRFRITVTEILPGHMKGWGQLKLKTTEIRELSWEFLRQYFLIQKKEQRKDTCGMTQHNKIIIFL